MATIDPVVRIDQIPPRAPLYRDDDDPTTKCDPFIETCEDLDFVNQWGLFKVEAEGVWNITTGSPSVVIAVLDSDVDLDHDDLAGNIRVNQGEVEDDGIDNDGTEALAGSDPLDIVSMPVRGDIDNSGVVNAADVLLANRAALGLLTLENDQLARGNVAPLVGGKPASAPDDDFNVADLLLITGKATGAMNF